MPIAEDTLHHCHVSKSVSSLHSRLQVNNSSWCGSSGDAPVEITRPVGPGPRIRVGCPGYVDAVQLVVSLIGPPSTLPIRKIIARSPDRRWSTTTAGANALTRNTDSLTHINNIGVRDVVIGGEPLPGRMVAGRDTT